jgi:hypothetical protein
MRRLSRLLPLFAFALALVPGPAHALVANLVPNLDNTLYESAGGTLSNGAGPSFFVGRTAQATNNLRRGLLSFDVAGAIPAGATITAATLTMHCTATVSGTFQVSHQPINATWGVGASNAGVAGGGGAPAAPGDATWRHRFFNTTLWTAAGGDFTAASSQAFPVGGLGPYTWSSSPAMVADVQSWLDSPGTNYGWLVRGAESTAPPTSKKFESRQSSEPALRPLLVVEYTIAVPAAPSTWGRIKASYH